MSTSNGARVKLYSFNENGNWEEVGTGHVTVQFVERLQGLSLIVRSEDDGSILLESKIISDRRYQRKEETIILWTEDDSCDLALSFQETASCGEVWGSICEFQGKSSNVDVTQPLDDDNDVTKPIDEVDELVKLPVCELGKLDLIFDVISCSMAQQLWRDNIALSLENDGYIQKLVELFKMCEDLENIDGLHHLYNIFRTLFLLNKPSILSIMFQPDLIMDVIGCLEYDPSKPHPIQHRHYLQNTSQHRDVIALENSELTNKIHLTYKIIYIQEVILPTPSLFEENMMSALNSIILFNKSEIVITIQEDNKLLFELLSHLCTEALSIEKYKELSLFLRELCHFAQALEIKDGTCFYQKLCKFQLMSALMQMLTSEVEDVVTIGVDILSQICDYNSAIIREHIFKQSDMDEDSQFLNIVIGLLVDAQFSIEAESIKLCEGYTKMSSCFAKLHIFFPSIDVQLVSIIKIIIDPEVIMTESNTESVEKTVFLNYFYKHCMHLLMAPLMAQTTTDKISRDTVQNAVLLGHVLDILSLCVQKHPCHTRTYVIDKNLLGRVLVLLTSSHGHLSLASLRFCRKIVGLKNEFYNRYIVRINLFAPIIKAFTANGQRYNLINSAILELFEYIKSENMTILITYIIEKFMATLESIHYVETFQSLKLKYDQEMDRVNDVQTTHDLSKGIIHEFGRYRRDPRDLDEDEESWFDDEEESTMNNNSPPLSLSTTSSLPRFVQPTSNSAYTFSPRPSLSSLTRAPLSLAASQKQSLSLVDYDEDSDEEQSSEEESNTSPSNIAAKRIKLDNT